MQLQKIASPIGLLLCVASLLMLAPAVVDLAVGHPDWMVFLGSAFITGGLGGMLFLGFRGKYPAWTRREGFVFVAASWIAMAFAGAVPLAISGVGISPSAAFFESVSGITSTGSTALTGLDTMPPGILLWRSLLQWIGGVGIVVFAVFLFPFLGFSGQQLFMMESSDTAEKAFSRFQEYALRILLIYAALTLACAFVYDALGMHFFDALNHAMTTVATGGFSTSDLSMAKFHSVPILWAATFFMFLGAIPFLVIVLAVSSRRKPVDVQMVWLAALVALSVAVIVAALRFDDQIVDFKRLTTIVFTVVSIVSTTGYAYEDYGAWPVAALIVIFLLTLLGGSSGSTSGGFKVSRLVLLVSIGRQAIARMLFPSSINNLRYGSNRVQSDDVLDLAAFTTLFFATIGACAIGLALLGHDMATAVSASATAVANVGPALGPIVGPTGSFAPLGHAELLLLSAAMLFGRLEILSLFVLLAPRFWRD